MYCMYVWAVYNYMNLVGREGVRSDPSRTTILNDSACNILVEIRLWIMDISHISQYTVYTVYMKGRQHGLPIWLLFCFSWSEILSSYSIGVAMWFSFNLAYLEVSICTGKQTTPVQSNEVFLIEGINFKNFGEKPYLYKYGLGYCM